MHTKKFYDTINRIKKTKDPITVGKIALVAVQQLIKQKLNRDGVSPLHALDGNADNYIEVEMFIDEKGGLDRIKQLDKNLYNLLEVHSILLQYGS